MATTLTPNLKLRIDSNLTANAKYNLNRLDLLGATFLVDSTNTVNLRSQVGILIEPNSADIGGSGTGGTVSIGTANHKITALNVYATDLILDGAFNLKDQAATSTGKLGLVYNSTASGTTKDDTARTLTIDVNGANRQLILDGSLSLLGGSLILNLSGSSNLNLPISGTLVARDTVDILTNKTINVDNNNTITNLRDSSIASNAAIDYLKLALAGKIVNADIKSDAAIAYGKLALSNSIKNSDISASPADKIVYTKLDLAGYIVDSDVSPGAAIAYSKLSLADKIKDSDIDPANKITYNKLILANSITDSDISSTAAINYSKLALAGQLVNSDISAAAAIAGSKIVPQFTQSVKTTGMLELDNGTTLTKIAPAASGQTADLTFKLPNNYGTANQTLITDGAGNLIWSDAGSGSVTSVNGATGAVTVNAINQLTGDVTAEPASGSESKVATIAAGAVTNSKIATNADIAVTKLAAGTDGYVLKTVAGTPTWSDPGSITANAINELTGDVTAGPASGSESKVATIANGVITDAKVSATANIAVSKLATGSEGQVLQVVSGVPTWAAASSGQTFPTLVTTWYSSESVNTKTIYHGFNTTDTTVEVYDKATGETVELDSIVRNTNNSVVLTKNGWGGTAVDLKILITALPTATPTITSIDYLNSSSTQAIVTVFFNNEAASYSTEIWDGTQYVAFDSGALTSLQAGGTNPYPVTKGFTQYFTRPTGGSGSVNARVRISYNSAISDWAYFTIDYQPSGEVPQLSFLNTPTNNDTSYTQDVGINWSGGEPTSIIIERFDIGSWQPVTTIPTSGPGQKWVQLSRMGSADTQYRIALSNTFGQSNWVETTVFGVIGTPANINMVNTLPVPGIPENFYFQVFYFTGSMSTNNYEIQQYIGPQSVWGAFQDYDPNNWSAAQVGGFFGNPFNTVSMAKPVTETAYRIRLVGNTFPPYTNSSTWQVMIVNPEFI